MKENISAMIALCNQTILAWYQKYSLSDLKMGEFEPIDKNDEIILETIYQMYLTLKTETKTKEQLLLPLVKYYFAIAVVEYYVLYSMDSFFNTHMMTKHMVEFSSNPALSIYRKKMLGFNQQPYVFKQLKYKFNIEINKNGATRL